MCPICIAYRDPEFESNPNNTHRKKSKANEVQV